MFDVQPLPLLALRTENEPESGPFLNSSIIDFEDLWIIAGELSVSLWVLGRLSL